MSCLVRFCLVLFGFVWLCPVLNDFERFVFFVRFCPVFPVFFGIIRYFLVLSFLSVLVRFSGFSGIVLYCLFCPVLSGFVWLYPVLMTLYSFVFFVRFCPVLSDSVRFCPVLTGFGYCAYASSSPSFGFVFASIFCGHSLHFSTYVAAQRFKWTFTCHPGINLNTYTHTL